MTRNRLLYIFIFILSFYGFANSQKTNPFELKSRKTIQKKPIETKKNVFNINKGREDVVPTVENNNPFELGNKNTNKNTQNIGKAGKEKKSSLKTKVDLANRYSGDSKFLLWVFLIVLVFLALLLSVNRSLVVKIIKVIWYYNHTNLLFRNFGNRELFFYIFLFINFVINLSIFLYLFIDRYSHFNGLNFFVKILGVVSLIYLFKHLSIIAFNKVFKSLKNIGVYNFTILLFNITLGLFLVPINLISAYSLSSISIIFLGIGVVLITILYILRLLRGFLITYDYFNISIFHFFLYLCTFEILPLLFLSKYFADFL